MVVVNVIILLLNITVIIASYYFIKNKIEKSIVNKDIIKKIKEEINSIIIQLNETTLNNINLIEDKKRNLDKMIILADKKNSGLNTTITKKEQLDFDMLLKSDDQPTYTPQKIVRQTKQAVIETAAKKEKPKVPTIDDEIKNLPIIEKANYLFEKGYSAKEIQKKIGISSGELEFIMSMENIKKA